MSFLIWKSIITTAILAYAEEAADNDQTMKDARIDLEPYGPHNSYGEPLDLEFRLQSLENGPVSVVGQEATWAFDLIPLGEEKTHMVWDLKRPLRKIYFGFGVSLNVTEEGYQRPEDCEALKSDSSTLAAINKILDNQETMGHCLQNVARWTGKVWRKLRTSSNGPLDSHARRISSFYKKVGATRFFPHPEHREDDKISFKSQPKLLLLSTHNRLFWYDTESQNEYTLHEGRGVYYGAFAGLPDPYAGPTVWVVSRPHNWRATSEVEYLLQFAADGSGMLKEIKIPTKFAHDAVRSVDGKSVYIASTGNGKILELDLSTMKVVKEHNIFKGGDHINTLSAVAGDRVWALLHAKGKFPSRLELADLKNDMVVQSMKDIGLDSHAAIQVTNSSQPTFLSLSSRDGRLVEATSPLSCSTNVAGDEVCSADGKISEKSEVKTIYTDPKKFFAKGLTVVDGVAYIGSSEGGPRQSRDAPDKLCELTAVNISSGKELWRKENLDCRGLLNVVSAPQLSISSTNLDNLKWQSRSVPEGFESTYTSVSVKKFWFQRLQELAKAPAARPRRLSYMPIGEKVEARDGKRPDKTVALLGHIPDELLTPLQDFFANYKLSKQYGNSTYAGEKNADFSERAANAQKFKPGVEQIKLIFSNRIGDEIFHFPWWREFKPAILPILRWLDVRLDHVARMQFAVHHPGADIKRHRDLGPWVMANHRTHVPVTTSPVGDFSMRGKKKKSWESVRMATGQCFEINNAVEHYVKNPGTDDSRTRIHLIIDWTDTPVAAKHSELKVGAVCKYGPHVECPQSAIAREVDLRQK